MKTSKLMLAVAALSLVTIITSCTKDGIAPVKQPHQKTMDSGGQDTPPQLPPPPHQ